MKIVYREAVFEDVKLITSFLHDLELFPRLAEMPQPELEQKTGDSLLHFLNSDEHSLYVAAGDDGEILGYTAVHWMPSLLHQKPEGYVGELFIHRKMRGQGVGTGLLNLIKKEALEKDCERLSLINRTDRESYQRRFYEKDGWIERDVFRVFFYPFEE